MSAPRRPVINRAIETLREIAELARIELAAAMGGPLTQRALKVLSYFLAMAWEAGVDYQKRKEREPDDEV